MKTISLFVVLVLLAASGTAHAEMHEHHHDMVQQASSTHQGVGIIKAVNEQVHKVQIAHDAIPSLNWPPMTMWFAMQGAMPQDLKAGDSVKFDLQQLDGNKWSITRIERK